MATIPERIRLFNKGRLSVLLPYKYAAMRGSSFRFYRGTCHLFYEDWPQDDALTKTPHAFLCGDLHMENFGLYEGDDTKVYFDINDFDESLLGPAAWDICRLLTSLYLASKTLGFDEKFGQKLNDLFIKKYTSALQSGQVEMAENKNWAHTAEKLLTNPKQRDLDSIIKSLTIKEDGKRLFITDKIRVYPIDDHQRERAGKLVELWNHTNSRHINYEVVDVALRITGTGSLGLERFIVLLKPKSEEGAKNLIEIKISRKSSALPYCTITQPAWEIDAERIKKIQSRMQMQTVALLDSIKFNKELSYVIKEIQPTMPKMNILLFKNKQEGFETMVSEMARVTAWAHLRSGGKNGAVSAEELVEFGKQKNWQKQALSYSKQYFDQVEKDYAEYKLAYDDGVFKRIK